MATTEYFVGFEQRMMNRMGFSLIFVACRSMMDDYDIV